MLRNSVNSISLLSMNASQLDPARPALISGLTLDVMSGRLMAVGLRKGARIEKIRKTTGGGFLFKVEEHRVVLHRSLAELIDVREEI